MNKFKVANAYKFRCIGDSSFIDEINVISRTDKTLNIVFEGKSSRKKIMLDSDGNEFIYPCGKYSKCPVCRAK